MMQLSRQTTTSDQIKDLPDSLQNLIKSLSLYPSLNSELVRQLLINAKIEAEELLPWATYDHSILDSYGRKLVYDGGYFEIMVMSWKPGDFSAIHDHGFTQWGAVQSFGQAKHINYQFKNNILYTQKEMDLKKKQIVTVNHDLIHQMGNPTDSYFLSLHIYGCNDRQGEITSNARIFDLFEGSIQYSNGGVFFCLPEREISQRNYNLRGDLITTIRHHQQMLDRVNAIIQLGHASICQWQIKAKLLEAKIAEINLQISNSKL